MIEPTGRTLICSVLFMDIVAYSRQPDARQLEIKAAFNRLIGEAVAGIIESERMIMDTGDGAAICFLGDPEDALFVATAVMGAVRRNDGTVRLRMGLNLGPIKVITDLNGRANVVGDGINVAQRVMSFADENEILVSRSFYEVASRLQEGNESLFRYLGIKKDKHVREHQIYTIVSGLEPPSRSWPGAKGARPLPGTARPQTGGVGEEAVSTILLSEQTLAREEQRLAALIGPLARVIVSRAARSAKSLDDFYQTMALSIQDEADRSAFLAGARRRGDAPAGARKAAPVQQPEQGFRPTEEELTRAEKRLARFEGPIAGMLVRREARAGAASRQEFYARLARLITDEGDRKRFLELAESDD